jgi:hypothetical protein
VLAGLGERRPSLLSPAEKGHPHGAVQRACGAKSPLTFRRALAWAHDTHRHRRCGCRIGRRSRSAHPAVGVASRSPLARSGWAQSRTRRAGERGSTGNMLPSRGSCLRKRDWHYDRSVEPFPSPPCRGERGPCSTSTPHALLWRRSDLATRSYPTPTRKTWRCSPAKWRAASDGPRRERKSGFAVDVGMKPIRPKVGFWAVMQETPSTTRRCPAAHRRRAARLAADRSRLTPAEAH